jgi:hypothetical protein
MIIIILLSLEMDDAIEITCCFFALSFDFHIAHGRFIDGLTSDGGTYSRGSSILTYVVVEAIVETELSLRKGGVGGGRRKRICGSQR